MTKLLIIRGPSGSGKSTISRELARRNTNPTLIVGEDRIRKMFSDHHLTPHPAGHHLPVQAVALGLSQGYDVIYQSILNAKSGEFRPDALREPAGTT